MISSSRRLPLALGVILLSVSLAPASRAATPAGGPQIGPDFQFGSAAFDEVAQTSYKTVGMNTAAVGMNGVFGDWITAAYQKSGVTLGSGNLEADLDARAAAIRAATGDARVKLERDTAAWAHTFIKKSIPRFSLERGFELANVVRTGERQCLAQSFIISGLLQRAGMQAGAVMVWSNPKGGQSNLGHVVSVVRLSGVNGGSGHDLLVDASDPTPFIRHQGLLVRTGDHYSFVKPSYEADDTISGYALADSGRALGVSAAAPLTLSYLHSQFDYYRGERAPGGILGTGVGKATPAGLNQSALYLKRALQDDPQNALASFMLGHVLARQGQMEAAKVQYQKASALYLAQGHTPPGVAAAIAALNKPAGSGKS
ncbi:tetratricopeptide repeat protein [Deinococcus sp.]|uniref:tetratricopeptide repeat protein n=1 Tax=Deinococcus sp. TaxID=47478 RepID=UPI003C7A7442